MSLGRNKLVIACSSKKKNCISFPVSSRQVTQNEAKKQAAAKSEGISKITYFFFSSFLPSSSRLRSQTIKRPARKKGVNGNVLDGRLAFKHQFNSQELKHTAGTVEICSFKLARFVKYIETHTTTKKKVLKQRRRRRFKQRGRNNNLSKQSTAPYSIVF